MVGGDRVAEFVGGHIEHAEVVGDAAVAVAEGQAGAIPERVDVVIGVVAVRPHSRAIVVVRVATDRGGQEVQAVLGAIVGGVEVVVR